MNFAQIRRKARDAKACGPQLAPSRLLTKGVRRRTRYLFGAFDWALSGDDNEFPLNAGFHERLIELIEKHQ
jgi:hypothetical protein